MLQLIISIAAGLLIASTATAAEPKITIKTATMTQDQVLAALTAFRAACPTLGQKWWPEVDVEATAADEYAPYRQELGWSASIHLAVKLPEQSSIIPSVTRETGVVSGHTLHYYLGGGKNPGFFAKKRVSQYACDMKVDQNGNDVFKPVPNLSVIQPIR